jgi:hypothetical protein
MLTVAALYHFTRLADPAALRGPLLDLCVAQAVKGSLLLAGEGINGTIAGTRTGIDAVLAHIRALPGCADLDWKESPAPSMPFGKMKVKLKREIVTMGQPDVDPKARVGHYVNPQDWNALISDFVALGFLPANCDRGVIIPVMERVLGPYLRGGGAKAFNFQVRARRRGLGGGLGASLGLVERH